MRSVCAAEMLVLLELNSILVAVFLAGAVISLSVIVNYQQECVSSPIHFCIMLKVKMNITKGISQISRARTTSIGASHLTVYIS